MTMTGGRRLGVAGAVTLLAGCTGTRPAASHDAPAWVDERVTAAILQADDGSLFLGPTLVEGNTVAWPGGGVVRLPVVDHPTGPKVELRTSSVQGGASAPVLAVFDLGATCTDVLLGRAAAERAGWWTMSADQPVRSRGVAGANASWAGVIEFVQVGPLRIGPATAGVRVARDDTPIVGVAWLSQAGGVMYDPAAPALVVYAPGAEPRSGQTSSVDPGWVSLPLLPPTESETELRESYGCAGPWHVEGWLGEHRLRLLIDTGAQAALSVRDVGLLHLLGPATVRGHGLTIRGEYGVTRDALRVGPLDVGPVDAVAVATTGETDDDGTLGWALLRRGPFWLDLEERVLRIWNGAGRPSELDAMLDRVQLLQR